MPIYDLNSKGELCEMSPSTHESRGYSGIPDAESSTTLMSFSNAKAMGQVLNEAERIRNESKRLRVQAASVSRERGIRKAREADRAAEWARAQDLKNKTISPQDKLRYAAVMQGASDFSRVNFLTGNGQTADGTFQPITDYEKYVKGYKQPRFSTGFKGERESNTMYGYSQPQMGSWLSDLTGVNLVADTQQVAEQVVTEGQAALTRATQQPTIVPTYIPAMPGSGARVVVMGKQIPVMYVAVGGLAAVGLLVYLLKKK